MKNLNIEKLVIYGAVGVAAVLVLTVWTKGVRGAVSGVVGGLVGGVVDAGVGIVEGVYTAIPNQVKPSSSDNVINQGVESIGRELTGDPNFTLGGWIYDVTH